MEFVVTIQRGDLPGSPAVKLALPATQWAYQDALDRARISCARRPPPTTVTLVLSVRSYLDDTVPWENPDLPQLNLLAQRLADMPVADHALLHGMISVQRHKSGAGPLPLATLINMTFNLDGCMMAGEVRDDAALGRFVHENLMDEEERTAADKALEAAPDPGVYLERLGQRHRLEHGGVFCMLGYLERCEMKQVYKRSAYQHFAITPGAAATMELFTDDRSVLLGLPCDLDGAVSRALDELGVVRNRGLYHNRIADCIVPQLMPSAMWAHIDTINRWAQAVDRMQRHTALEVYKAVVRAEPGCPTMERAINLAQHAHHFSLDYGVLSGADYAARELPKLSKKKAREWKDGYSDMDELGRQLARQNNERVTAYGLARRLDGRSFHAPFDDKFQMAPEQRPNWGLAGPDYPADEPRQAEDMTL